MKALSLSAIVVALSLIVSPWSIAAEASSVPDTMRAAAIDKGGDAEALSLHRLPVPKPGAGEVLIAVNVAGVGVWQAKYRPRDSADFPVIAGSDGAGVIAAVGSGVHGFKVGDQVYGTNGAFYAEYATVKMEPLPRPRYGMRMSLYSFIAGQDEFQRRNKAVEAAKLQVPIAAEYPLTDAAQAHKRLAAGHLLGKIVIRVR